MKYTTFKFCPNCDVEIEFEPNAEKVVCSDCKTEFDRDIDAEFVDGSWKDRSTLTPTKTPGLLQPSERETEKQGRITKGGNRGFAL